MRKAFFTTVLLASTAAFLSADTLYLRDGRTIDGTFLSGTSREIRFIPNGSRAQTYPVTSVSNIIFGANSSSSNSTYRDDGYNRRAYSDRTDGSRNYDASGTRARTAGDPNRAIPTDTTITVRMIDPIDSDKNSVGQTFRASVDEPIVVNGQEIAPRGADATVQVVSIQQGGKITGNEEVGLRLVEIRGNNGVVLRPVTSDAEVASKSRGQQSAAIIGGSAVVGAILGAIAGGGKGAAIGAASGAGAGVAIQAIRGQRVQVPSESKLDFHLTEPLYY